MQCARDRPRIQRIVHRAGAQCRVSILITIGNGRPDAGRIMDRERTIAAETRSPRRAGDPGPRAERPATEMPRSTTAKPGPAEMPATEMRATEVSASTSHPAAEMTASKVTASAKMPAAAAVTASTASRSRIGRTRNHDRENSDGQDFEL
jgi:hypothetical protein